MCINCWVELGAPQLRSDKITKAADLVNQLYSMPTGISGGHLHILTDDWNTEDEHVQFCRDEISAVMAGRPSSYNDPAQLAVEDELVQLMLELTEPERGSTLGLAWGYFD